MTILGVFLSVEIANHSELLVYISCMSNHHRHPFDSSKWGRICQFLISEGVLDKKRIVEPLEASRDDLRVVGFGSLKFYLFLNLITFSL